MRLLQPRLFTAIFVLSLGSFTANLKASCSRLLPNKKAQVEAEAPTPTEAPAPAKAEATPVPTPILHVDSGAELLRLFGNRPSIAFAQKARTDNCPDFVKNKILYFDERTAVKIRENCKDVSPRTVRPKTFEVSSIDESILLLDNKVYDRESERPLATSVFCTGAKDSGKRDVSVAIKRDLKTGEMRALLVIRKNEVIDRFEPVVTVAPGGQNVYQSGTALTLTLVNLNGLTGFLNYDFKTNAAGALASSRKESKLTLPNCYTP